MINRIHTSNSSNDRSCTDLTPDPPLGGEGESSSRNLDICKRQPACPPVHPFTCPPVRLSTRSPVHPFPNFTSQT
jgi:hypothetical protein